VKETSNIALFPGENLSFETTEPDLGQLSPDSVINDKYVRGEIRIVTEQARYPLNTIAQMVESESYKLSPEYQRRHRWDAERQSRLIESLIMNVPIPPVFLYEYDYSRYEVMDGLQRLTAIRDFYKDKFPLTGLTQWRELNGRTYSGLPEKVREGIDRRYLSSVILLKETAKSDTEALRLKQMVFERLNSGGEQLTPQETRNAIFDGPLNRLCIKLSKTAALCRLWDIPEPDQAEIDGGLPSEARSQHEAFRRMEDVELVLRFFAYRQKHRLHKGTSLSIYLDNYLRQGNEFSETTLKQLEELFLETITLVEDVFGPKAFWLFRRRGKEGNWTWLERPTQTVYDPLMLVMSTHMADASTLRASAVVCQQVIAAFYQNNYEVFEGRNVNPSALSERERKFEELVSEIIVG
jgi:Protein of unknown function DUF262